MNKVLPRHIFLQKDRACYIDLPKAGCTGIRKYLASELNINIATSVHNVKEFPIANSLEQINDSYRFTFVRHPITRLFSCYKEKIREKDFVHPNYTHGVSNAIKRFGFWSGMSFSEFLDVCLDTPDYEADNHFKSMHQIITHNNSLELPQFIGKIENFKSDFEKLKEILEFSTDYNEVSDRNSSSGKEGVISSAYSKVTESDTIKIKKRYAIDYELFNYSDIN